MVKVHSLDINWVIIAFCIDIVVMQIYGMFIGEIMVVAPNAVSVLQHIPLHHHFVTTPRGSTTPAVVGRCCINLTMLTKFNKLTAFTDICLSSSASLYITIYLVVSADVTSVMKSKSDQVEPLGTFLH